MTGPSTTSPGTTGTGWPPDEPTPGRAPKTDEPAKRGWWSRRGAAAGKPPREKPARREKAATGPRPALRRTAAAEAEWAARRQSRRNILVTTLTAGLILLVGAIGYGIWHAQRTTPYPVPAHLARDGEGVVAGGSGPVTVDVYADFACAGCRSFVLATQATLDRMVAADQITLVLHPLSRHDTRANAQYSTRAAASLACASDMSRGLAYSDALWAAEPAGTAGLSDDRLVQVAGSVGIIDPRFAQCLRDVRYRAWVGRVTHAAGTGGNAGTPTVLVDGASIVPSGATPTVAQLSAAISSAAAVAARGK